MINELTYLENILLCNEKDEKANRHFLFKTATCKEYVKSMEVLDLNTPIFHSL